MGEVPKIKTQMQQQVESQLQFDQQASKAGHPEVVYQITMATHIPKVGTAWNRF